MPRCAASCASGPARVEAGVERTRSLPSFLAPSMILARAGLISTFCAEHGGANSEARITAAHAITVRRMKPSRASVRRNRNGRASLAKRALSSSDLVRLLHRDHVRAGQFYLATHDRRSRESVDRRLIGIGDTRGDAVHGCDDLVAEGKRGLCGEQNRAV